MAFSGLCVFRRLLNQLWLTSLCCGEFQRGCPLVPGKWLVSWYFEGCTLYLRTQSIFTGTCSPFLLTHLLMLPFWPRCYFFYPFQAEFFSFKDGLSLILIRTNHCFVSVKGNFSASCFPSLLGQTIHILLHHFPVMYKPVLISSVS